MTCARNADDYAFTPAFMAAFQRGTHYIDVADTFKAEIHAAVGQFDNHILNWLFVVFRVDAIGRTHFGRQFEFLWIGVNGQNTPGFRLYRTLNHRKTNTTQAKYCNSIALFYFRRVVHRADTGGDTTT